MAGYDVLNEAVLDNTAKLNVFYKKVIKAIRGVDQDHILFIEGNRWAMDLGGLTDFNDDNLCLSVHFYLPLDFTFNFVPHLRYPLRSPGSPGKVFNKSAMDKVLAKYRAVSRKRAAPIFVGEFGVNTRQGYYGEDRWLKDVLACFEKAEFHWTYWTYKAIKNAIFPDGIYSYMDNPPWVSRHGHRLGWDNYSSYWPKHSGAMIRSWKTEQFTENREILRILKTFLKKR